MWAAGAPPGTRTVLGDTASAGQMLRMPRGATCALLSLLAVMHDTAGVGCNCVHGGRVAWGTSSCPTTQVRAWRGARHTRAPHRPTRPAAVVARHPSLRAAVPSLTWQAGSAPETSWRWGWPRIHSCLPSGSQLRAYGEGIHTAELLHRAARVLWASALLW